MSATATLSSAIGDPAFWHRLQFGFTITFHYLFPQLTMGLAWLIVLWKWRALRTGDERYATAARLWTRIFGLTFAVGVVTGIPMEFQFGTNWGGFSKYAGGVIGQTLAMEGMFAFFLESALIGVLVGGGEAARAAARISSRRWASRSGAGSRRISSWPRTPSCRTRSARRRRGRHAATHQPACVPAESVGARRVAPTTRRPRWSREPSRSRRWARITRSPTRTASRPDSICAGARAPGCWPRSSSRFRRATCRRRWSRDIRKSRSPPWRGRFESGPMGRDHAHRTTQCGGASSRQPDQAARRAEFPRVRHLPQ